MGEKRIKAIEGGLDFPWAEIRCKAREARGKRPRPISSSLRGPTHTGGAAAYVDKTIERGRCVNQTESCYRLNAYAPNVPHRSGSLCLRPRSTPAHHCA